MLSSVAQTFAPCVLSDKCFTHMYADLMSQHNANAPKPHERISTNFYFYSVLSTSLSLSFPPSLSALFFVDSLCEPIFRIMRSYPSRFRFVEFSLFPDRPAFSTIYNRCYRWTISVMCVCVFFFFFLRRYGNGYTVGNVSPKTASSIRNRMYYKYTTCTLHI